MNGTANGRTRIVEFVGLPGVGKTTMAKCLIRRLDSKGISTSSRTDLLADSCSVLRRHMLRGRVVVRGLFVDPRPFYVAARIVLASHQGKSTYIWKLTWNLWCVVALMIVCRRIDNELIVNDQGLFQAVWSVSYSGRTKVTEERWRRLLQLVGVESMLLVALDADVEIVRKRLELRQDKASRVQRSSDKEAASKWKRSVESLAFVLLLARSEASLKKFMSAHTNEQRSIDETLDRIEAELDLNTFNYYP